MSFSSVCCLIVFYRTVTPQPPLTPKKQSNEVAVCALGRANLAPAEAAGSLTSPLISGLPHSYARSLGVRVNARARTRLVRCIASTAAPIAASTVSARCKASPAIATSPEASPTTSPSHTGQIRSLGNNLVEQILLSEFKSETGSRAHLQISTTENTLVQDKCLGHKTRLREFHISVPRA